MKKLMSPIDDSKTMSSQKILFTDVSANPIAGLAVGAIFDGTTGVTAIIFDRGGLVTDDEFLDVAEPIISRGLRGARIGEFDDLSLVGVHRDGTTHPSSTDCEIATFRIAQQMLPNIVVGDSVAVEKLAYVDGLQFVRCPGHGVDTPLNLKVVDRLSRKILRGVIKYLAKK